LVLREVEYFRRAVDVDGGGGNKIGRSKVAAAAGGGQKQQQKKKKKGGGVGNGSFLPKMCSSAEVADSPSGGGRRERPARIRYRPLGEEGDALPRED
jgi:hypothetical protein